MDQQFTRRKFMGAAGAAIAAGTAVGSSASTASAQTSGKLLQILGINCSPRAGKTTAAALQAALDAAAEIGLQIDTRLIELAGMNIGVFDPANPTAGQGGFKDLIPVLSDTKVAGIILGTPVYFSNMSSLCKAFLDHCMVFRKNQFALSGKVAGVIAVGGARNGGQELAIQSVHAALLCQEMTLVGDGKPTAHTGATLWNRANDDISTDEFGLSTARNLGRRVAEVASRLALKTE
jgi:multimeric flavodoxin WrbA